MVISDANSIEQGFYTVYCIPHEGCLPFEERKIHVSANVEAEQLHINDLIKFVCCCLWSNIVEETLHLSLPDYAMPRRNGQ